MERIRTIQARIYNHLCRLKFELGQTTSEYALVLLAAAAVAIVLIKWATTDAGALQSFFTAMITKIRDGGDAMDIGG